MTPEKLSRIREIYEQALPLAESAREAYVNRECQGEDDVRAEVERLLTAHDNIPSWLERPPLGAAGPFAPLDPPKLEGRTLSGYTLIREIGRGGMGRVYLAERSDNMFHRQTAVKLILPPFVSVDVVARFQQEREILASLDHPNIAKLLDAGVTEEGWPYFVMEFVEGQPIHRWCDERKLNVSQRIELFRGVIEAVRYAHQHLVVHRDLKPGNIFVTNEGVVKLLDFGIAKVVSNTVVGKAADTLTLVGMMTPEYASPEQVNGVAITTQSDVYSLGVVLYELLTGHRPYRLSSAAIHEIARVIAEVEPARPSDIVTKSEPASGRDPAPVTPETVSATREGDPKRLSKRLRGDLDSILLMALRKEPEHRYRSVESLADDLQRHLGQRKISAREATPWENIYRSFLKNRAGFTVGGVVLYMFLFGVAAVALQARHDIEVALDFGIEPYLRPLLIFSLGLALCAQMTAVYFSRASMTPRGLVRQRFAAVAAGLVWGLGVTRGWWVRQSLGWWHSRIPGHSDPLVLNYGRDPAGGRHALSFSLSLVVGTTLMFVLYMIGRRFGWKGQAAGLVLFALGKVFLERIWFGEVIPLLEFKPGITPALGSAAMLIAIGLIAVLVMRLIGGPDTPGTERQ